MSIAYILGSVIMMTMFGLAVGNYATSITFRLPRGLKIANDPPYCDTCRQYLAPRDLFPFFSWVINKAKCRFCAAPVPALYAFVELACAMLFNAAWFVYWPQAVDEFIVMLGIGVFIITLVSLHIAEKRLFPLVVVLVAGFGAIHRVLLDNTIFGMVTTGYLGLMAGVIGWGIRCAIARRRVSFPNFAIMAGLAGLCVSKTQLPLLIGLAVGLMFIFWLAGRKSASLRGSEGVSAISLALMVVLLFPNLTRHGLDKCALVACSDNGCHIEPLGRCPYPVTSPLLTPP